MFGGSFLRVLIVSYLFMSICFSSLSAAKADADAGRLQPIPSIDNCTATLHNDLSLDVPVLLFYDIPFQADFQAVTPATPGIELTDYAPVLDETPFKGCRASLLSPDLVLHVPNILFAGVSLLADFQYSNGLTFSLIGTGLNSDSVLYRLSPGSTYQEGCVGPCMCPVTVPRAMSGTFRLVPLFPASFYTRYSLDDVSWTVMNPDGTIAHTIKGFGIYQTGGEFAGLHRLTLELSIDSGQLNHFDSGLVNDGAPWPAISMTVDQGSSCYDVIINVVAVPVPALF